MGVAKRKVLYSSIAIIIIMFFAWVGWTVLTKVGSKLGGPMLENLSDMNSLSYAIKSYYDKYGLIQTNREALEHCVGGQVHFTDYWGNPFHFKVGPNTQWIEIISFGADGLSGKGSLVITQILTQSKALGSNLIAPGGTRGQPLE